jgi:aspartate-semialdehyde dehydrogenase
LNCVFEREITVEQATKILSKAVGVSMVDVPTPLIAAGKDPSFVGRIRQDHSIDGNKGLALFVSNDNLRKGAALNALQIAEVIVSNRK